MQFKHEYGNWHNSIAPLCIFLDIVHTHSVDISADQPKTFSSFSRSQTDESDVEETAADTEEVGRILLLTNKTGVEADLRNC